MSAYKKVLVAIDLGEYSGDLIEKGLAIAGDPAAVHVAFVHQRMDTVYTGFGPMGSALAEVGTIEDRLRKDLIARLKDWADAHGIPESQAHFLVGKPSEQIEEFAEDHDVDLIVIATHSRKGLQRLLGSTANAVVNDARCDVLSVRTR